jgi:hypothetical protein
VRVPEALEIDALLRVAAGALALVADDLPDLRLRLASTVVAYGNGIWRGDAVPLLDSVVALSDALNLAEASLRMLTGGG